MAIVEMKKLSLAALEEQRESLLAELMRLGCVEISEPDMSSPELDKLYSEALISHDTASIESIMSRRDSVSKAIALLDKYAPVKKPMFSPKTGVREFAMFDGDTIAAAVDIADEIIALGESADKKTAEINALENRIIGLEPWKDLDIPLDFENPAIEIWCGTVPLYVSEDKLRSAADEAVPASVIREIYADRTQRYIAAVVYGEDAEELAKVLRRLSFARHSFADLKGYAKENLARFEKQAEALKAERAAAEEKIRSYKDKNAVLEQTYDALTNEMERQNVRRRLMKSETVFFLCGWLPKDALPLAENVLRRFDCAYGFEDPGETDDVPVALHNGRLAEPFGEITSMYGMPAYNSYIDPTAAMGVFYALAFGIMLSDAAYGIMLSLGCLFLLKKKKPSGTFKNMLKLFMYCGISTTLWGLFFGSFFGNAVAIVSSGLFGREVALPYVIDPITNPIEMMALSYAFGAMQIFTAIFFNGLRCIKRKDYLGAIFGVYSWYVLFIGIALLLLIPSIGKYVAIAGALMVMIGGSLGKKGFGKITGGFLALYGISGYFSDLLSYSRLLALGLSTAVVSNVFNTMGSLMGFSAFGTIFFFIVLIVGHVFNFALNLLGSYVHTSRLQYIEFFGRFYEGGGKAFTPLKLQTKYVDIIKEV